jgi:pimeloyl-ACP methyl ester carboxylesterase
VHSWRRVSRTVWLFAAVGTLVLLWVCSQAVRAYRDALIVLRPPVGPVQMPADAAAFGLKPVVIQYDSVSISAWYAPPKTGATILLCTGTSATRIALWNEAAALIAGGHGVLMFDWPGHGESGGDVSLGIPAQRALKAVIDAVERMEGTDSRRIGLYGFSFGGVAATSLLATDARVKAVVLAGTPIDLAGQNRLDFGANDWVASQFSLLYWRWRGESLESMSLKPVAHLLAPRPVLIVAGSQDHVVTTDDATELARRIGPSASLWIIPGAGHGDYGAIAPEYGARLVAFFSQALPP